MSKKFFFLFQIEAGGRFIAENQSTYKFMVKYSCGLCRKFWQFILLFDFEMHLNLYSNEFESESVFGKLIGNH